MEDEKSSYHLKSLEVKDTRNSPILASVSREPSADVTPLCIKCRACFNSAWAKILTDDFISCIDEYSLKGFPVAFAMYNAFYWMDYL